MTVDRFGEDVAARYDETSAEMFEPAVVEPAVEFLTQLAGDGGALELGIGTGRLALPLAARGVRVAGIDLSGAMVDRMRAKPGGEDIEVAIGDFATTRVAGTFRLAYLVFNTINNLTTQDEQVACFVVEVGVPDLQRLPRGETYRPFRVEPGRLGFDEVEVAGQGLVSHHVFLGDDGTYVYRAIPFRYVWPSELDLMARIAGMTLRERWADWNREPFTAESTKHVSVWEKR